LAYAHFIYAELAFNPALEQKPNAPPQRLEIQGLNSPELYQATSSLIAHTYPEN
jgi:hypothetical protein